MEIYKDYTLCSFGSVVVVLKMFCYKWNFTGGHLKAPGRTAHIKLCLTELI